MRLTYQLGKPLRRNLTLVSAHQADRYKLIGQWQASGLENRLVRQRILMTALGTIVLQLAGLVVTVLRVDESVFSATLVQRFQTCHLSRVLPCLFKKLPEFC